MRILDKAQFLELLNDTETQKRFQRNFEQALREHGVWYDTVDQTCQAASKSTGISYTYFELALHGRPVWSKAEKLCTALGVSLTDLFEKELATSTA